MFVEVTVEKLIEEGGGRGGLFAATHSPSLHPE